MNLHEYQAKQLFAKYGLKVPNNVVIRNIDEAQASLGKLGTDKLIVKAQVHAGGRGKAGGVKLVNNKQELLDAVRGMLHTNLVTYQTDAKGKPVNELLIEETCDIEQELYLGAVVDRATQKIVIMASTEGGMEIEKVAASTPDKILKITVDPMLGVMPYQCRDLGFKLNLNPTQIKQFTQIAMGLGKLFQEQDLSLVEINPLVITKDQDLLCLDGKINIDENALYRQPKSQAMFDPTQEDQRELKAKEWNLSYISLDGNIGCMVNGAGLAMATMDLIKLSGGEPANFLDVGGTATKERVCEAFKIILSDSKVKAILINIFGGIVRCDLIAEGIIGAVSEVDLNIPVIIRLEGNRALEAQTLLNNSGLNLTAAASLQDAADQAVAALS